MKNNNSLFVVFCLCLTVGLMGVYVTFVGHFNGKKEFEMRLSAKQKEVEQERFQNALLSYQLKDFQQSVAQLMPDEKKLVAQYDLKTFSSAVRSPASESAIDLSGVLFEKGKTYFNNQDYERAIKEFNSLLEKYPLSRYSVESQFFVAESYFLKRDFRNSLERIDEMVTQYPSHDLTGFILLRMGQISELNNQTEEASEIYNTVLKNFQNDSLKKQAAKLAKSVSYE
ncbi:tetratricopeptide repeat protein [Bdellovibrio sp. HCB2-146]|uniref:tetratricopeptide repeat protein n=1 Tax=Bdellovibrio sp. HCB2-146 TaxID=3394362 RepID=UPI0039BD9104